MESALFSQEKFCSPLRENVLLCFLWRKTVQGQKFSEGNQLQKRFQRQFPLWSQVLTFQFFWSSLWKISYFMTLENIWPNTGSFPPHHKYFLQTLGWKKNTVMSRMKTTIPMRTPFRMKTPKNLGKCLKQLELFLLRSIKFWKNLFRGKVFIRNITVRFPPLFSTEQLTWIFLKERFSDSFFRQLFLWTSKFKMLFQSFQIFSSQNFFFK